MKKYILKFKESKRALSEYASREEASVKLMEFINDVNKSLNIDYLSPFDFCLEEVECEVNEGITDFENAKKYLVGNTKSTDPIKDAEILIKELNPKHIEALVALNRLFTIAEAWNKADGFVPDFSNWQQDKWYSWFKYDKDAACFVYAYTNITLTNANVNFGSRLCFKTRERAEQFGKQFADLYNKVFL